MISNDIKALAISLRTQVSMPKCVESLGKRAVLKPAIEKLEKALRFHKGEGYEMDLKAVPIERYTIHVFSAIVDGNIPVQELKAHCQILTEAEKDSILEYCQAILKHMGEYEANVATILRTIRKAGITIDDVIELEIIKEDEEEAQDIQVELQALAYSLRLEYPSNQVISKLSRCFVQLPVLLDLEKALNSDVVGTSKRPTRYSGSKDVNIQDCTVELLDKIEAAELTVRDIRDQATLLSSMEKDALLSFFERLRPTLEPKFEAGKKILKLLDKSGMELWELEEYFSEDEAGPELQAG